MDSNESASAGEKLMRLRLQDKHDFFVVLTGPLQPCDKQTIEARGIKFQIARVKYLEVSQASAADLSWFFEQKWCVGVLPTLCEAMTFAAITSGVGLSEKLEKVFGPRPQIVYTYDCQFPCGHAKFLSKTEPYPDVTVITLKASQEWAAGQDLNEIVAASCVLYEQDTIDIDIARQSIAKTLGVNVDRILLMSADDYPS